MLYLNGIDLTVEDAVRAARAGESAAIGADAAVKIDRARRFVEEKLASGEAVYGLTTGFGKFSDTYISPEDTATLQRNLIISHACAMGDALPEDVTRLAMLLRANSLCRGNSGIRRSTVETLLEMLNKDVVPVVPEKGSLGASGDLAPLAHIALVMMGMGEACYMGERLPGEEAMRRAGIKPVVLAAKEGLALINGTQIMTAVGLLAAYDAAAAAKCADVACALTCEALLGIKSAYDPRVHALRPHKGQGECARNLLKLLEGSDLAKYTQRGKVQDAYSLRCAPQIHGASRDAIAYALAAVETEINSVTDNPLVFPGDGEAISGGNFHGQPLAIAFDLLGIAVSELADVSERRTERLVNPQLSSGLPAFLTRNGGLNSGFMIAQYAAASMVSENKVYAHPASVDSIPSSANQEDHVSMGTTAARKARMILDNTRKVLGIELLCAAEGLYFRGSEKAAPATRAAYERIRTRISALEGDAVMYPLLNAADEMVKSGELLSAAEGVCGALE